MSTVAEEPAYAPALPARPRRRPNVLPGFGITLGFALGYLGIVVLLPLAALIVRPWELGWDGFWESVTQPRVLASLKLSFGAALIAATVNGVFGLIVAWVLVRYDFPGKRLFDALVDLPFALPTAVAGIALTDLFAPKGLLGAPLADMGIKIAFTPAGVTVALVFIGLPFVVRTLQPVMEDLDPEVEESSATLGATRWQTVARIILPAILPALATGFAMALARAVGEYGSVIFIAGNMPLVSEIAPLLIVIRLEQYDYAGAAAVGLVMLAASFVMLLVINMLQAWGRRRTGD